MPKTDFPEQQSVDSGQEKRLPKLSDRFKRNDTVHAPDSNLVRTTQQTTVASNAPTKRKPVAESPAGPAPALPRKRIPFSETTSAILHFSRAGTTVTLRLNKPIILGRGTSFDVEDRLDLTDFGGYQLGVSRSHCQLRRGKYSLTVTDLDSSNGTFLNDERLMPNTNYNIEHGDKLRLGSLEITILFHSNGAH